MKRIDLLILSWHQTYLSKNAGGYIRLSEFLKRAPKTIGFKLLDNTPTIYSDVASENELIRYQTPRLIKVFEKRFFILWFMLENITTAWIVYFTAKKLIRQYKPKVLYVPIGEFFHLYLPAIILKLQFPQIRLVVDILNFEIPDKSVFTYYQKLRKSGQSIIRSILTIYATLQSTFLIKRTVNLVDYIFTVSPDLISALKKYYRKESIDFTPSGVDSSFPLPKVKKKFLGVYLGRMTVQKGVFELLDVWSQVIKKIPNAKLALMGQADDQILKSLKEKITEFKLDKNISVFGSVSEEKKRKILSASQLFLHLARYEPLFPVIGILEGLSFGLPAIVYNMKVVSSQQNILKKWKCLYIIENGSTKEVVKKIQEYYKSTQKTKNLLSLEAKKFANLYDWDKIAKKEFGIILDLIFRY
ncbi:hypothetical protein A3A46_01525 [Candidatus Roizmanbacteria bacterium RIFCSPLOWO2_01_FULL_37_13]|nr:MAG: hypothetical protein A3A46_01525 [Candidatus Roizmanbacteria bacterium RIFCSPLOWO2_01_FULL_37_13]